MEPPPLASLIRFCNPYVLKDNFSAAVYSSGFHTFNMYHCICTGEKKVPSVLISGTYGFYFSFWEEKVEELRTRRN